MAVFMLAYALAGSSLPAGVEQRLASIVAAGGHAVSQCGSRLAVAYADLKLWPESGIRAGADKVFAVSGDPVLCSSGVGIGREAAIDKLQSVLLHAPLAELRSCEGSFSAFGADTQSDLATVVVDKLAVRPVYVGSHQGVVYVASALWMLERLADIPKHCDWRGIAETAAFGYPLADRTAYLGIEAMPPGSALVLKDGRQEQYQYWDWRDPSNFELPSGAGDPVERVEAAFHQAVDDRLGTNTKALAFLSGGMDSRLIASRLRQRGVELDTLNFAPEGSADLAFGRLAADAMGARHSEFGAGSAPFAQRKSDAIAAWRSQRVEGGAAWADDVRLLWSGDGGSVVLGHVYLDDEIVSAARNPGLDRAAELIQSHNKYKLSPRLFRAGHRDLATAPLRGIREELARCARVEPGRAAHLFSVLNDQRRHLVSHYEHVHELGFDLHLPFFDGRFMQTVFSCPVDLLVGHKLYNRLFERLPFGLGHVPWQAYPGHEPCPVKQDETLRRQWSDGWFDPETERRHRLAHASQMQAQLSSAVFPSNVLSRLNLALALRLTRWGVRDYSYLATSAKPFVQASEIANARG